MEHIKNFYKKFTIDNGFLDIIKNELDKNFMLAQYGVPEEIKHLFDYDIEDTVKSMNKFNL